MTVVWSNEAYRSFNGIVDYLLELWTVEIAANFVDIVEHTIEHTIEQIIEHPEIFKVSEYDEQSREAFITKHTTMFYRVLADQIEIEYFWGNFENPDKIKDLLKFK